MSDLPQKEKHSSDNMEETRGEKFGRNLAYIVEGLSYKLPPEDREKYLEAIAGKVRKYSLKPRKKGEPAHEGCRHSLERIDTVRTDNPEEVAAFVEETFDITYNKQRAATMQRGFLKTIDEITFLKHQG